MKWCNILEFGGTKKLVTRRDRVKYYFPMEDIFDVIDLSHIAVRHKRRDRLKVETLKKYANRHDKIFFSSCETCQKKKKLGKKGLVLKPILHTELISNVK